jgi:hypothetical protein
VPLKIPKFTSVDSLEYRVWVILIEYASVGSDISYSELLTKVDLKGLVLSDLFPVLIKIGDFEHSNNRPWINGLVISSKGEPGVGFYNWCKGYMAKEEWYRIGTKEFMEELKDWSYTFWSDRKYYKFWSNKENFIL